MTTKEIAMQLVTLCRANKNIEAIEKLMSADIVSVEAEGDPAQPESQIQTGVAAVKAKNEWWVTNHTIHSSEVKGPFPHGDRFSVIFNFVVTPKTGPMVGKTMRMEEVALYTVADGKITREEFFYDMGDAEFVDAKAPVKKPGAKKKAAKKAPTKKKVVVKAKAKAKAVNARAKSRKSKSQAKKR